MPATTIQGVWVQEQEFLNGVNEGEVEIFRLRLDWHNGRHHSLDIPAFSTGKTLARELRRLANALEEDPSLH